MFKPLLAVLFVLSCTYTPDDIDPVSGFEAGRYLGTWYEIARFDHRFERNLVDVTATYSLREDGGIDVLNRGFDTGEGTWKEARGKAYFVSGPDIGQLKVSFFWPFYGGYNIIELDKEEYSYALVCGPDKSFLWILARQPVLDPAIRQKLTSRARELGFEVENLISVQRETP